MRRDRTAPGKSLVLAALGAGLVLAIAGRKARGSKRRRTYALARRVSARATGKTRIRRRAGETLPDITGGSSLGDGYRPDHRYQKQSTQNPLHCQPPS